MTTSIGKLSKSFFVKLLVGIIILPFVFWGMGDVFRGGNQNVIATIDSKKLSTQDFIDYLNRLNLSDLEIKNIKNTDLVEKILADYIGKKVMSLEIKKFGITVNDNSLRDIIKSDELFSKNNKFSRTEYEKFLLKSGSTAPVFEKNIAEQESRRQFLSYISGGLIIPNNLVQKEYQKENQTKQIKFINLKKFHEKEKASDEKIQEIYEKNISIFMEEFKNIRYAEITPQLISSSNDYDETFKQLDILENNILDGQAFEEVSKENNLKVTEINSINSLKKNMENKIIDISDALFKKIYSIKDKNIPEVINLDNKFYLAEVISINKIKKSISDPDVKKVILSQIVFQNKIKNNASIAKDISMGGFVGAKFENFASKNGLEVKNYKISNLKQNEVFNESIIKRIFNERWNC